MDARLVAAPSVVTFDQAPGEIKGFVEGLYVGGSLASGDYRPGTSDIDAVALVRGAPTPAVRTRLVEIHREFVEHKLHCVYVPRGETADVSRRHWTWASGELYRRPFSGVGRAELLADPVVVRGAAPSAWLPPMGVEELRRAARQELAGYWARAVRKRAIWREDVYVDIGLTTLARAEATMNQGVLITKTAAIARLGDLGVPEDVVEGIALRRDGQVVVLDEQAVAARALVVRHVMRDQLRRLLA